MQTGRGQSDVVMPVQQSLLELWRGDGMKAYVHAFVLAAELRDNPRQHAHPEHRRCSDAENARSRSPDQRNRLLDLLDPEEMTLDSFVKPVGFRRRVQSSTAEFEQLESGCRLHLTEKPADGRLRRVQHLG